MGRLNTLSALDHKRHQAMSSQFRFLSLPPELRREVYEQYLAVVGGYICPADRLLTGRLRQANGRLIEMSLIFTCKQVHAEMNGIAFRLNTITFSTICSTRLRLRAAWMDFTMRKLHTTRRELSHFAGRAMTDQVYAELSIAYPRYVPLLDQIKARRRGPETRQLLGGPSWPLVEDAMEISYGESPSLYREFCAALLRKLFQKCPDSTKIIGRYWMDEHISRAIAECELNPWDYPSDTDLHSLQAWVRTLGRQQIPTRDTDPFIYRFSAATAAIHFLNLLPLESRMQLRSIILNEDKVSVAFPESHAQGLIRFCRENVALRIERRVDLWRSILPSHGTEEGLNASLGLNSRRIIRNVSQWMVEASSLAAAGMPEASFKLVLDADPAPQQATVMFQLVVQMAASWQDAWTKLRTREGTALGQTIRRFPGLMFRDFPQTLRDITAKKSVIRCNFDVDEAQPLEAAFPHALWKNWGQDRWTEEWINFYTVAWRTRPSLPEWRTLVRENILQNDGSERHRRKGKRKWRNYSYQLPT